MARRGLFDDIVDAPPQDSYQPRIKFDITGAKTAGYSDADIARYLSSQVNFNYDGAVNGGYSPQEVIGHLSQHPDISIERNVTGDTRQKVVAAVSDPEFLKLTHADRKEALSIIDPAEFGMLDSAAQDRVVFTLSNSGASDQGIWDTTKDIAKEGPKGIVRGLDNIGSMGGGAIKWAGDLTGVDTLSAAGESLREYYSNRAQREETRADVASYKDVNSLSDGAKYLVGGAGEMVPMMAPGMGGALVGRTVLTRGAIAGLERKIGVEATKDLMKTAGSAEAKAVASAATKGTLAGAGAASYGMELGSIYADQAEQGIESPGRAAAFAVPAAMLDVVGELPFLAKIPIFKSLQDIPILRTNEGANWFKRGVIEAIKGGGAEGATEFMQTLIERGGALKSMTDAAAFEEAMNAGILGGFTGGVMSGAGGVMSKPHTVPIGDTPHDILTGETIVVSDTPQGEQTAPLQPSAGDNVNMPRKVSDGIIDEMVNSIPTYSDTSTAVLGSTVTDGVQQNPAELTQDVQQQVATSPFAESQDDQQPAPIPHQVEATAPMVDAPATSNPLTSAAVEQEIAHLTAVASSQKAEVLKIHTAIANGEMDPKQAKPLITMAKLRAKAAEDAVKQHAANKAASVVLSVEPTQAPETANDIGIPAPSPVTILQSPTAAKTENKAQATDITPYSVSTETATGDSKPATDETAYENSAVTHPYPRETGTGGNVEREGNASSSAPPPPLEGSVINKSISEQPSRAVGVGTTTSANPFFDPTQISASLSGLKSNLQEDMPKLVELGKKLYSNGAATLAEFTAGMRKHLGEKYESFKVHMVKLFMDVKRIIGNEKGKAGKDINGGTGGETANTPLAERLHDKTNDLIRKAQESEAGTNLLKAWDGFLKIVRPSERSDSAKQMEAAMLIAMGRRNRSRESLTSTFDTVVKQQNLTGLAKAWDYVITYGQTAADVIFSKMGADKSHEFMQAMDSSDQEKAAYFSENPHLKPVADVIDSMFQKKVQQIRALNVGLLTKELRNNYFPHIWKNKADGSDIANRLWKKPIEGKKDFTKHRIFDDVNAGLEAGYEPISDNPIDLVFLKMAEMDKLITIHEALQAAERAGGDVVRKIPVGDDPPTGYMKIHGVSAVDIGGERFKYIVREDVAQIMNNYTSESLWSHEDFGGIYRGLRYVANTLNRWQLGVFSLFHASFTTGEAMISHFALSFKAAGDGEWSEAGHYFKTGFTAGYMNPKRGIEVLKNWRDSSSTSPMNRLLEMAGASFAVDGRFFDNETQQTIQSLADKKYINAAWHGLNAIVEQSARPIMEHLVPAQKAGVFAEMADYWLKRNPEATQAGTAVAMQQIWNRIDSRLGQVVYDRLFVKNWAKNAVQLLIRAPGWTGGTILEVGGGIKDLVKSVADAPINGGKLHLTDRAAYVLSMFVTTSLANSVMTAMMAAAHGKDDPEDYLPHDWRDLYSFRTGNVDEFGKPVRFILPTYMKELYAYATDRNATLKNKLHPIIGLVTDVAKNKDFSGVEVRHPDDNYIRQAGQVGSFVAKAFIPFWMRGVAKELERDGDLFSMGMPFIGVMPAPKRLNQTDAEALASELAKGYLQGRSRTQEEANRAKLKSKIKRAMRLHPGELPPEAEQAAREGKLPTKALIALRKQANVSQLVNDVNRMNLHEALKVWNKASDIERESLRPVMGRKMLTEAEHMTPSQIDILREELKKAGLI